MTQETNSQQEPLQVWCILDEVPEDIEEFIDGALLGNEDVVFLTKMHGPAKYDELLEARGFVRTGNLVTWKKL